MMSSQEVPQGYKQTKVGVILEDWEIINFGSLAEFRNGLNFTQKNSGEAIKIVGVANFKKYSVLPTLKDLDVINVSKMVKENDLIKDNDVLYVRSNGNKNLIGRCLYFPQVDEKLSFSGFTIRGRVISPLINPKYFALLSNSKIVKKQFSNNGAGTNISNLSQQILNNVLIPLPSLKEQQKIANILTTWDDAISKQDELIKAKEELKKGLMQKLLSGEVRFDGFNREWEEIPLKEALIERKTYSEKGLEFVHVSLTKEGVVPKSDRYERDFLVKDDNKKYKITYLNDICYNPANLKFGVICKNTLGTAIFSPIYITFELNKNHNIDFFGYLLTTNDFINRVRKYEQGTVYERMAVSPKDFLSYKLKLPSKQEQQKIAQVLGNADKEIDLLKNELQELKEQKKGLMQKLLTGEVRVNT